MEDNRRKKSYVWFQKKILSKSFDTILVYEGKKIQWKSEKFAKFFLMYLEIKSLVNSQNFVFENKWK